MNIEQIGPAALRLPAKDRAQLAASLWESIEDPYRSLAVDREDEDAISTAVKRDAELESGSVQALSHSELMKRLRR